MPRLTRGGVVLGPVEVLASRRARGRGLLGRGGIDGVALFEPCRSVHTIGMRFPIDVAFCRRLSAGGRTELAVVRVRTMVPGRVSRPVLRAGVVLEAEAGCFTRWSVQVGDRLAVVEP